MSSTFSEKISIEVEKKQKAFTYYNLLTTESGQMPNPYDLTGWLNQEIGANKWPKLYESDIDSYFERYTEPGIRERVLSKYKVIHLR